MEGKESSTMIHPPGPIIPPLQRQISQQILSLNYFLTSIEFRRLILDYIWFIDLFQVSMISKECLRDIFHEDYYLANVFFNRLLSLSQRFLTTNLLPQRFNLKEVVQLAMRCTPWPSDVSLLNHEIPSRYTYQILEYKPTTATTTSSSASSSIHVPSKESSSVASKDSRSTRCFYYQGRVVGRNRSVIANDHFPVVFPTAHHPAAERKLSKLRPISALPFMKTVIHPVSKESVPVMSHIAYYEITILPPVPPPLVVTLQNEVQTQPCVSIGIARPGFDLYHNMPGWDRNSYAFHGDDGLFFCGNSEHGYRPIANFEKNRFTSSDTVGFGIIYPTNAKIIGRTVMKGTIHMTDDKEEDKDPDEEDEEEDEEEEGAEEEEDAEEEQGSIFFTKNGVLQGILYIPDEHFFEHSWFPAIGTDSYNPIEINFGNVPASPFLFNILAFEFNASSSSFSSQSYDVLPEVVQTFVYQRSRKRLDAVRKHKIFPFLSTSSLQSLEQLPVQPYMIYPPLHRYSKEWKTEQYFHALNKRKHSVSSTGKLDSSSFASDSNARGQQSRSSSLGSRSDLSKKKSSEERTNGNENMDGSDSDSDEDDDDDDENYNNNHEGNDDTSPSLKYLNFLLRKYRYEEISPGDRHSGVDSRGLFHHRQLLALTIHQLELEGWEEEDDSDFGDSDNEMVNPYNVMQPTIFPYNSAGPFFMNFEYEEEDNEEEDEEGGHEFFGAEYADYEDLQTGMQFTSSIPPSLRGSKSNLSALGNVANLSLIRQASKKIEGKRSAEDKDDNDDNDDDETAPSEMADIMDDGLSEATNPKDIGEGKMDWMKSLMSSGKKVTTNRSTSSYYDSMMVPAFPTMNFQFPQFPTSSQQAYQHFNSAVQSVRQTFEEDNNSGKKKKKGGMSFNSIFRSSSDTSLQDLSSSYQQFLRDYPAGVMHAYYYDSEGNIEAEEVNDIDFGDDNDEDEDYEEDEEGEEEEEEGEEELQMEETGNNYDNNNHDDNKGIVEIDDKIPVREESSGESSIPAKKK